MKTIGLIGGMSWESTAVYYRLLNQMVRTRLGGLHSAQLLLWSFDFADIERLQDAGDWKAAGDRMVAAARRLEAGGADCIVICTNTMHRLAEPVEDAVGIPLLHIADATGRAVRAAGVRRPLLLATRHTMEQDFYTGRLAKDHGIEALTPAATDRETVHRIIYGELCRGIVSERSRAACLGIVDRCRAMDIDGIILGCTEVGLLLTADDSDLPVFDTTAIHADAALEFALGDG
jgi:aspartate racemase